jgi:outer membrane protein TolC
LQAAGFGRGSGVGINGSDWATGTEGLRLSRYNYAVGFTLTFPLLDFPQMRARLAQETYRTAAEKSYLDEQTGLLHRDLAVAEARLAESQARVAETPVQLEAARAAFTQMSARYDSGLANLAELAQVQFALNRAEVDHTLAVNEVWNAWLHKAAGQGDLELFLHLMNR